MVGDDWGNDIAPAMRAGLRAYWINTNAGMLDPKGLESDSCARGTLADFGRWLTEGMLNAL
jgi:FMN phosphatase YigB (HAD superfamily)